MEIRDFQIALMIGKFDEHLDYIISATRERKTDLAPKAYDFKIGDRVRMNNANPKYLNGALATIKKINRTKVVIDLDERHGKFYTNITAPTTMLEKI